LITRRRNERNEMQRQAEILIFTPVFFGLIAGFFSFFVASLRRRVRPLCI